MKRICFWSCGFSPNQFVTTCRNGIAQVNTNKLRDGDSGDSPRMCSVRHHKERSPRERDVIFPIMLSHCYLFRQITWCGQAMSPSPPHQSDHSCGPSPPCARSEPVRRINAPHFWEVNTSRSTNQSKLAQQTISPFNFQIVELHGPLL